jgi:hypothetical protein
MDSAACSRCSSANWRAPDELGDLPRDGGAVIDGGFNVSGAEDVLVEA